LWLKHIKSVLVNGKSVVCIFENVENEMGEYYRFQGSVTRGFFFFWKSV